MPAGSQQGSLPRLGMLATGNLTTRVVLGLGNAERQYLRTRHNAGAMAVARSMERMGLQPRAGLVPVPASRSGIGLPNGFMNESGTLARAAVQRWRPTGHGLVVVHDDLELPLGEVEWKEGGGHGGHNGLRDVIAALGTGAFRRIRIGISRPPGRLDPAAYVLAPFGAQERPILEDALDRAAEMILGLFPLSFGTPPAPWEEPV